MYKTYEEKYMNTTLQTKEETGAVIPNEIDLKNANAIRAVDVKVKTVLKVP